MNSSIVSHLSLIINQSRRSLQQVANQYAAFKQQQPTSILDVNSKVARFVDISLLEPRSSSDNLAGVANETLVLRLARLLLHCLNAQR